MEEVSAEEEGRGGRDDSPSSRAERSSLMSPIKVLRMVSLSHPCPSIHSIFSFSSPTTARANLTGISSSLRRS